MWWNRRSAEKEWMDLESYDQKAYADCLWQLDRVGQYLGGDKATFRALKTLSSNPKSILDVGCGGGFFAAKLAKKFPKTQVVGIDISTDAIKFAKNRFENATFPNLSFMVKNILEDKFSHQVFDIVTSTLVFHHLTDEEIPLMLKGLCQQANQAVIINDLHRHALAYYGFALLSPLLFRNRMVFHDGLISIKRAFTREDWMSYLNKAKIPVSNISLKWNWAFRWILQIDTSRELI
ncbi:MAG: class I SAM-dependent methyltransferase [Chlamydiales bacterium]